MFGNSPARTFLACILPLLLFAACVDTSPVEELRRRPHQANADIDWRDQVIYQIMIDRWDGRMGFPGGTLNEGESIIEGLVREIKEEVGITVKPEKVHPIASHEWKISTHFYGLKVLEIEFLHIYYHILNNFSRSILLHAYEEGDSSHFMSEITGIKIVPLVEYAGKGINHFVGNHFAGSSKDDLLILMEETLNMDISAYR